MTSRPGEIWLADIPFTNGQAAKIRPVLILWLDGHDAVLAAVTSAPPRSLADVALSDWQEAGLRVTSTVRLSRLDCLEQFLLRKKLGRLSAKDSETVKRVWIDQIQLQF